jgi:hypothetical protein
MCVDDDYDFRDLDFRYYRCPACEGDGGEVGECLGKLIWIKCEVCEGHGILDWEGWNDH